ncbi:glycoside hydrolase [Ophiobolus disseminans]|uniref:chitinase n=1 Tax=Ophiobolus disseminans TaxID=1469910 RepID=A0A6A6ZJF8_9PLEO|nr:glycoside hydrolase [Ophiobolus disseminans]
MAVCGANTCKLDCDRKAECNPGFGSEWATRDKCPLNVCCSKHGFCGTTEEFCGDKKVAHKTCSKDNGNALVVGYYEGWAKNRPCNVFWPEQIPIGIYTHINFAFAIIDPKTFKIAPSSPDDANLYKRLMLLKQRDPNLKVYIAVGGWAFNDPGPTASTFSDLAASVPRQKIFMESLLSFMSTYGFDGIDLDWEYPVADDRSGREVDFDNFPKFMARLKQTLSGASKGLTITLPASYWYLQHFDLASLVKSVDWFNIMSYDLHGTWDQGNKWTGAFLNSHTNLTEIDLALDLLWRNNVDPSKVVMGLAFYGRTFSVTSESCKIPGCTYQSGGQRGKCSREVGILLNSEIDDLVKEHSVTPTLYKKETAKVATWGNQWVAYDDEETLVMKSEHAQTLCLGGLMVWAISHDTVDAKYHKALAKAANRKITSLPMTDGSGNAFETHEVAADTCKWTNCGESCPSGWFHVKRSDPRGKKDEYMYDETSCGPKGVHNFCCPTQTLQPDCGWYTQVDGKCDPTCPQGMIEIGSYNKNCKDKKTYQAACCSSSPKSMALYTKGEWGKYPMCEEQSSCPAGDSKKKDLLGSANAGSGQAICNAYYKGQVLPKDPPNERKFCYDGSNSKQRFSDCVWYGGVGTMPSGAPKDWCLSGCPSNRVRIGRGYDKKCANQSYRALCCVPHMTDSVQVDNPKLEEYRNAMAAYVKDPKCDNPGFATRDLHALMGRAEKSPSITVQGIVLALLVQTGSNALLDLAKDIWNKAMERYTYLQFPALRDYIKSTNAYRTQGPIEMSMKIVCSPNYWNSLAAKTQEEKLNCIDGIVCEGDHCELSNLNPRADSLIRPHKHSHHNHLHRADHGKTKLDKRFGPARDYSVNIPGGGTVTITLPSYPQIRDYAAADPANDEVVDFVNRDDCTSTAIQHFVLPTGQFYHVEHPFDGNVMGQFMRDAVAGRLRSGAVAQTGAVFATFFREVRAMPANIGAPPLAGNTDYASVLDRVMDCVGSRTNIANFVFAHADINAVKGRVSSPPFRRAFSEADHIYSK